MTPPKNAIAWFEIPVSNLDNAQKFYESVLQTTMIEQKMGPSVMLIFPVEDMATSISGHLYEGKPAIDGSGPTIHLTTPAPLEDALERVKSAGGKVISEEVKVPDGRFFYCQDPDGNSLGLFNKE